MSGFQYFLPNKTKDQLVDDGKLRRDALAELGLAERCIDLARVGEHFVLCDVHTRVGPGSEQGTMLAPVSPDSGAPSPVGNHPNRQIHRPIFVNGAVAAYVVANKDELPTPHDMLRHKALFATKVVDRFGQEWKMPICRTPHANRSGLPEVFSFDSEGRLSSQVQEDFAWAYDLSSEIRLWYQDAYNRRPNPHEFAWVAEQVLRLLAINYRIGKEEVALLTAAGRGFLTGEFVSQLAYACFDYDLADEAKKKPALTGADGAGNSSSSTPGERDDSPAIAPASAA